ncbi:MAG TPA: MBL fold metallo-hydrolase [Actinomycetota bacterium]|jgi:glyoxylase-like metal-dependent hydrolase (beta-lactamase superfamily II)|nr:MBL fold metallo-hydrolase [Actinomycetota bacterium]
MAHQSLTVGGVQVTAVCDVTGDFPAPLERAFPAVPAAAWAPWRRRHPEAFSGTDHWRLRDWCFVVRARDRVALVDTGVGGPGVPGATWIGTPGRLPEELAAAGVDPDEIDLVVLTHLHLDHIGWNLAWDGDRPRPRFPRARYLAQRADWELFGSRGDENDREAFDRCVAPLQDLGVAELLDGDRVLDRQLTLLHTPGHTPGSQSLLVASGGDAVLLWGDVANHPAQIGEPDWGPGSDVQPEVARRTRRRLLERIETEAMWLGPAHFPEPFGTVTRAGGARRWEGRS